MFGIRDDLGPNTQPAARARRCIRLGRFRPRKSAMKKVGVVVLVVVLLVLALPAVLGAMTETKVRDRVEAFDSNPVLSAEVRAYERGWLKSRAIIDVALDPAYVSQLGAAGQGAAPPFESSLALRVDIAHGPIAVLDGPYFGLAKTVAYADPSVPSVAEAQQQLGVPYLFRWRGRLGFTGGLTFDAEVPPFELPADEAGMQFSGAYVDGTLRGNRLVTDARIDSAQFSSPNGTFALRNLRGNSDNEILTQYLMPGTAAFSIERISLTDGPDGAAPVVEVANLRMASDMTLKADDTLFDARVTYDLDSMIANGMRLSAGTMGVAFNNIDVAVMNAYVEAAQRAANDPAALLASVGPLLERGLAAGPSFAMDPIRFELDDEPFDARLELSMNPDALPPAGALDVNDPSLWMAAANAKASVNLSKKLAERLAALAVQMQLSMQYAGDPNMTPQQLQYLAEAQSGLFLVMLTGQGILLDSGDGYRSEFSLANGTMTLNGNPLPFGLP
jgi:uncharacterized protein YdgA (DUF945 family)